MSPSQTDRCVPRDSVDALLASWQARRPDLDFAPVGVIARLSRLRSHLDGAIEEVFAAHGLTSANFAVLVTLARIEDEGGVSQRRLMEELGLTSGTISVRMDRLVEEGLVERRPDPASGRNTLITLTARGRELFERVVPAHLDNERRLLAALSREEEDELATLLRKLLVEFEGALPPDGGPSRVGLTVAPAHVTMAMRKSVGLEPVAGLLVRAVDDDSPAAAAGIKTGDVLVRASRRNLRSVADLYAAIDEAGNRLRIDLLRGNDRTHATLTLGKSRPDGKNAKTAGRGAAGVHRL
jgi:DNA-binding MarR family transcriptional regulator